MTEADTCRELVTPKRVAAGWGTSESVLGEQHSFTNGRIIVAGGKVRRGKQRRADYLLYYQRDMPLAVVEAKEVGLPAETGVQQAREYAEMLGLKFAYWSLASKTMRTARSITSGENFGDFLMLAPFSIVGASSESGAVHPDSLDQAGAIQGAPCSVIAS